jgi:hypothetical protein
MLRSRKTGLDATADEQGSEEDLAMSNERENSLVDSAIIRTDVLKRSKLTSQPETTDKDSQVVDLTGHPVRIDPRQRELLRHPFHEGREKPAI